MKRAMKRFTVHRETVKVSTIGGAFLDTAYHVEESPDAILGAGDRGPGWYRWQVVQAFNSEDAIEEAKSIWKDGVE